MTQQRFVLDEVMPSVRVSPSSLTRRHGSRVAFLASYGADRFVSRSLAEYVHQLELGGYDVVLIRASDTNEDLIWPDGMATDATVIYKPNIGYDFGTWATGMAMFPQLLTAEYVLLVNDSLVGPFASIQPMLDAFEATDYDVWGVTNTTQLLPHLQSYVMGFRGGILTDRALREFWSGIEILDDKNQIIEKYEVGLSRLLFREAYLSAAWFDHSIVVPDGLNPSLWGWRKLVNLGFPFVKRQLITLPELVSDGAEIPDVISAKFGIDPHEWV